MNQALMDDKGKEEILGEEQGMCSFEAQERNVFADVSEEVTSRFMMGTSHHLRTFLSEGVVCDTF
jgi:hypothetical protein